MKLIVGLGNPGRKYAETRHNAGFLAIDRLARKWGTDEGSYAARFEGVLGQTERRGTRVLLLKPQTFMNLSGRSVLAALRFYKIGTPDVLVVYDDLDLAAGQLRIRSSGSAGGHNGLSDIVRCLGTQEIARVRIGIGRPQYGDTVSYVLAKFSEQEREEMEPALDRAADAAACWVEQGLDTAMNRYNRRSPDRNEK